MSSFVQFHVHGLPQPKGSTRSLAMRRKDGGLMTRTFSDNPKLKAWQQTVATAAKVRVRSFQFTGPVAITLGFYLPHPTSGKRRLAHVTRPDVDKLSRAVLDALTGVLWTDDAQVIALQASKTYCAKGEQPHLIVVASDAMQGHDSAAGQFVNREAVQL